MDKSDLIQKLKDYAQTLDLLRREVPQTLDEQTIEQFRRISDKIAELQLAGLTAAMLPFKYREPYAAWIAKLDDAVRRPVDLFKETDDYREQHWDERSIGLIRNRFAGAIARFRTLAEAIAIES